MSPTSCQTAPPRVEPETITVFPVAVNSSPRHARLGGIEFWHPIAIPRLPVHAEFMQRRALTIEQLRGLLGARLRYHGLIYTVIEILDDRFELILEADLPTAQIQTDAYGNARREMRALVTIPVLSADHSGLHPEFLAIAFL